MSTQYTLYVKLDTELDDDIKTYYTEYKPSHDDDSGFDLPAMIDYRINTDTDTQVIPVKSTGIKFGVSCCMIDNTTGKPVGYYLYPRSSFHKYNLIVANHLGIIDAGYRGPITGMVKPFYLQKDSGFITIDRGTKLFQLCAPDLSHFNVQIVDTLPESSRGSSGFGSTGK